MGDTCDNTKKRKADEDDGGCSSDRWLRSTVKDGCIASISGIRSTTNNNKLEELQNRILNLENEMAFMKIQIIEIEGKTNTRFNMFDGFESLPKAEQDKYVPGGYTGLMRYSKKETSESKTQNFVMCSRYKAMNAYACKSKQFKDDKYVSKEAKFIDISEFSNKTLRKNKKDAFNAALKHFMVCDDCSKDPSKKESKYIYYLKTTELCVFCFDARNSEKGINISLNKTCRACYNSLTSSVTPESCLLSVLKVLEKMYKNSLIIEQNVSTRCNSKQSRSFMIDVLITGSNFHIIIERDQNQHRGYNLQNENDKLVAQANYCLSVNNMRKIFIIRYNPNSPYTTSKGGTREQGYGGADRLIILRRWIIWYIENIDTMRRCIVFYMWYDKDTRSTCVDPHYPGLFYVDDGPKMVVSGWDWCVAPCEIPKDPSSSDIEKNSKSVIVLLGHDWENRTQNGKYYIEGVGV